MSSARLRAGPGLLLLLFVALPLLGLAVLIEHGRGRLDERARQDDFAALERRLDIWVSRTAWRAFMQERVPALAERCWQLGPESPAAQQLLADTARSWQCPLELAFFRDRKYVVGSPDRTHRDLLERVFTGVLLTGEAAVARQKELQGELWQVFGASCRLELLRKRRGLTGFILGSKPGAYYWDEWPDGRGVFVLVPLLPDLARRCAMVLGEPGADRLVGVTAAKSGYVLPPAGLSPADVARASALARAEGLNRVTCGDRHWVFCENQEDHVWCAVSPVLTGAHSHWPDVVVFLALLGTGLCLGLLVAEWAFAWRPIGVPNWVESLPLRLKLVAMFAMAAWVPLLAAITLGALTLLDRGELMAAAVGRAGLSRILGCENGFAARYARFFEVSQQLRQAQAVQNLDVPAIAGMVGQLVERNEIQRFEVRDHRGAVVWTTDDPTIHGTRYATNLFSKNAMARHAGARLQRPAGQVSPEEVIAEPLFTSDDVGMATLIRYPGRSWKMTMADHPALYYWDVYPELATGAVFIGTIHQVDMMLPVYLTTVLQRPVPPGAPRLTAFQFGSECTSGRLVSDPQAGDDAVALLAAAVRSHETRRVVRRELHLRDGDCFVTMRPDNIYGDFVLIDLVNVGDALAQLGRFRLLLVAWSLLALAAAGFGAWRLSSLFLVPVRDLAEGVAGIRRRDESWRIPVRRPDEFGALASAFNRVLADLKELQYGRIVQESLLPHNVLPPAGYELLISRRSATDLAGDYHDVVPLADGRVVAMLGDVTGHGISAALAMAMARATVAYQRRAGWEFPGPVLDRLNALFHRELRPQGKYMTFGCLVLSPDRHHVLYENAGGPYPLAFAAATGTVVEWKVPSAPLGMGKRRRSGRAEATLAPGDAVLLYTDGFSECPNPAGDGFGYGRLLREFGELMRTGCDAAACLARLNGSLDDWRAGRPLDDDVTLVVLRRLSGSDSNTM